MTVRISLGNKVIGIVSFVAIIILALSFMLSYFGWETLLIAGLLISIYSSQASKINYISLSQGQFLIENIFRPAIPKKASLFNEVTELFPFTHLMSIKFKDGTSYLFWGRSDIELNRLIKETLHNQK